jgi:uncharacterized protein YrzB (UPF0473 family)
MPIDPENGEGHVDGFDESEDLEADDLVTIQDEDGKQWDCAILAVVEHESAEYALLAPVDQLEDEEGDEVEMFLFVYQVDDDGTQTFSYIEDDETYEAVREAFTVLMETNDE